MCIAYSYIRVFGLLKKFATSRLDFAIFLMWVITGYRYARIEVEIYARVWLAKFAENKTLAKIASFYSMMGGQCVPPYMMTDRKE